jgi:hypothetical protein
MDRIPAFAHPTQNPLFPAISRKFVGYMGRGCSRGKIVRLGGGTCGRTQPRRIEKKRKEEGGIKRQVCRSEWKKPAEKLAADFFRVAKNQRLMSAGLENQRLISAG